MAPVIEERRLEEQMTTDEKAPDVPEAVERFVAAINNADTEAFVACFTTDGYVDDWGRVLKGATGVRSWADTDAIGAGAHMTILTADTAGNITRTEFAWRSRVFNGESTGIFTLEDDKISSFTIPPNH